MPAISAVRQFNASYNPTYVPIVLITGATSGIGQALAELFARILHGRVHIILVGRNRAAAERIIATLVSASDTGAFKPTYEFIPCDITIMKNIHEMAHDDLLKRLPKINYLIHCAGISNLAGRVETAEGIDVKLASRYYSRFALTYDLLPLLRNAVGMGEPAKVMSVLAAGMPFEINLDDLGLKKNYSAFNAMLQSGLYNEVMMEEFAHREPAISWVYTNPGGVYTPFYTSQKPFYKTLLWFLHPLLLLITISPEDCAEYMAYALLNSENGLKRYNGKGDDIGRKMMPKAGGRGQRLWEHSGEETGVTVEYEEA